MEEKVFCNAFPFHIVFDEHVRLWVSPSLGDVLLNSGWINYQLFSPSDQSAEDTANRRERAEVCPWSSGQRCYTGPILHYRAPTGENTLTDLTVSLCRFKYTQCSFDISNATF